tara:strand:+ start:3338 stop:4069 length:732 start_codon:yes stop_codon:yes gene_type:complete
MFAVVKKSYRGTTKMNVKKVQKTVAIQEALAMCFAAQRINGAYLKDTRRFSCEENLTQFANKDIVKQHFGDYQDPDFVDINPIEEDFEDVDIAQKHFRRYTLGIVGDTLSEFQKDVFDLLSNDTVPFNKLGLLAYVPELVKREVAESKFKKILRMEYRNSVNIANVKDPVEGVIKILSKFWSEQWESYNYVADYNGSLVSFMNKYDHIIGERKRLKGKVKAHGKNRNFDVCETRLNYVKLFKV